MTTKRLLPLPLLALLLLTALPAITRAEVVNKVVLRVNDQIATLYDYEQRRAGMAQEILRQQDITNEQRRELLAQVGELAFKDMYEELLLESRAEQLGVEVSEPQIDQQIEQMKQNYGIENDEQFAAALAQSGLTEPELRQRLSRDLRAREVMGREVQSRIKVDEDDLRRYYQAHRDEFRQPEQLQLREVVVLEEGGLPTAEERAALAAGIRQSVSAGGGGKQLADVVSEYAQKGQTSNVIDIGWVSPGDLDPGLEAAIWKLAPGTLSEPIAGRGGLHLVEVVERKEANIPPFAAVQEQIRMHEQRRRMQDEIAVYMGELEKKSLIVAEPPPGAEGFRSLLGQRPPTEDERLGLNEAAQQSPEVEMNPGTTPMQDSTGGAPGALPEPKPTTNNPPPVVEAPPPAAEEPPPPPPPGG